MVNVQGKGPLGITIFGSILIITSLLQLSTLSHLEYYQWLFSVLPEGTLRLRYFISVALRVLGFASGIGILLRKDLFRKIAIGLSVFTTATIYWKHPMYGISKLARVVVEMLSRFNYRYTDLNQPFLIEVIEWGSLIALYAIDLGFAIWLIYYFTRPKIVAHFKR